MYLSRLIAIVLPVFVVNQLAIAQFEIPVEFAIPIEEDDRFSDVGSFDSGDEEEVLADSTDEEEGRVDNPENHTEGPVPRPEFRPKRDRDEVNSGFSDDEHDVQREAGKQVRRDVETALMIAARNDDVPEINRLAQMPGFDVNAQNALGATALHAAAGANAVAAALRLLELGAARDIQTELGETPFAKAQASGFELLSDILSE